MKIIKFSLLPCGLKHTQFFFYFPFPGSINSVSNCIISVFVKMNHVDRILLVCSGGDHMLTSSTTRKFNKAVFISLLHPHTALCLSLLENYAIFHASNENLLLLRKNVSVLSMKKAKPSVSFLTTLSGIF